MTAAPLDTGMDVLDRDACFALLAEAQVGRLVFVDNRGRIEVFPVNYALDGETVVVRTDTGRKLVAGGHDAVFEVDHLEPGRRAAWSVLVRGLATLSESAGPNAPRPWLDGPHPYFVRIAASEVTGRRFGFGQAGEEPPSEGPSALLIAGGGDATSR